MTFIAILIFTASAKKVGRLHYLGYLLFNIVIFHLFLVAFVATVGGVFPKDSWELTSRIPGVL